MKYDLSSMTLSDLKSTVKELGFPAFRAEQIFRWFARGVTVDEMTDLSLDMRNFIKENCTVAELKEEAHFISEDGTEKYVFALHDGYRIETALMKYKYGNSVCISSQAGCRMGCAFCASTLKGKERDLTAGEMLAQVAYLNKTAPVSHVVIMGVGEPLDNYDSLLIFLQNICDPKGMNLSARHISVSTCGLVDKILALSEHHLQITLSVSLHAPNDGIRNRLMPVNRKYPVAQLIDACKTYIAKTNRRISFEYILIDGVNDTDSCAEELASLLKGMLSHVNLIPVNFVEERGLFPSSPERIKRFSEILEKRHINTTVRRTLGKDIAASCGQLRLNLKEGQKG